MLERFFFDTSAFLAVVKNEPQGPAILALNDSLKQAQCVTSVLVAYELYRGVPLLSNKRKSQARTIDMLLERFTLKAVFEAHAMAAAKLYRYSKGQIDPILAAQCVEGGFTLVTANRKDFERVPGLRLARLST